MMTWKEKFQAEAAPMTGETLNEFGGD